MFTIREATEADNHALLHLEAASPQGTGLKILIDRDTYFYRPSLFDHGHVLIAEEDGKLVGIMAFAIKDMLVGGEPIKAAYIYDFRGEAGYRRSMKRGLYRLWREVESRILDAGVSFLYGHIKADNDDSMRIALKMEARPAGDYEILTLPSPQRTAMLPGVRRIDWSEGVERIDRLIGKRDMRPLHLEDAYRRGDELGYLRGIYRMEHSKSSAQISVWDTSSIYQGRVIRMPRSLKALRLLVNPIGKVLPLPRIPGEQEKLTYWHLFDPLCEGPNGRLLLKRIVNQIRFEAAREKIAILTLFYDKEDPYAQIPRFLPCTRLTYRTMVKPYSDVIPTAPLHIDIRDI